MKFERAPRLSILCLLTKFFLDVLFSIASIEGSFLVVLNSDANWAVGEIFGSAEIFDLALHYVLNCCC